ncbi:MAG TPA: hypothetical protein VGD98_21180 [Ktedonobacteraceae bacterium]
MMSWFDKHRWSRRQADLEEGTDAEIGERKVLRTREALAASVEVLTTQEKPDESEWEEGDGDAKLLSGTALIPPRLRLQSRPLPAFHVNTSKYLAGYGEPMSSETEAQVTSLAVVPSKRLGRSTKVRLQAVHPGPAREPVTERVPITERDLPEWREPVNNGQVLVRRLEAPASMPSSLLCGSGVIEEGQEDVTIHNSRVSAQSVVTVMLSSNPGPVVVHYVSLQPLLGFTLHMSAPVSARTSFTYAIWLF